MSTEIMLHAREQKRLDKCEDRIAKGMIGAFYEVGKALAEINENGLYQQYGTFAGYVSERWGMKPQYAYKLIKAAGIMDRLQCIRSDTLPTHETQVRHLSKVDPDHIPDVWAKVIEVAPRTEDKKPVISEKLVKTVVEWWSESNNNDVIDTTSVDVIDMTSEEVVEEERDAPAPCPNCGAVDRDEDERGQFCRECQEPIGVQMVVDQDDLVHDGTESEPEYDKKELARRRRILRCTPPAQHFAHALEAIHAEMAGLEVRSRNGQLLHKLRKGIIPKTREKRQQLRNRVEVVLRLVSRLESVIKQIDAIDGAEAANE